jgi:metal-responsive CopG/Arc/MetJ family transcriptional regulator
MSKKVLSITVEEKILIEWKKYTEEKCINSSQLIEKLIKEYLKKGVRK